MRPPLALKASLILFSAAQAITFQYVDDRPRHGDRRVSLPMKDGDEQREVPPEPSHHRVAQARRNALRNIAKEKATETLTGAMMRVSHAMNDAKGGARHAAEGAAGRMGRAVDDAKGGASQAADGFFSKVSSLFRSHNAVGSAEPESSAPESVEEEGADVVEEPERQSRVNGGRPSMSLMYQDAAPLLRAGDDGSRLPEVSALLGKSSKTMASLTSRIRELKQELVHKQEESHEAVTEQKAKYEAILQAQRLNTSDIIKGNSKLQKDNAALLQETSQLRDRADSLQSYCGELRKQLMQLQDNMSTVQELLSDTVQPLEHHEDKVKVLRELDEFETSRKQEQAHQGRLRAVSQSGVSLLSGLSLLQIDPDTPHDFVDKLDANLDVLADEQDASLKNLKEHFEAEYKQEVDHQADLMAKRAELEEQQDALVQLKERLQAAGHHLDNVSEYLHERVVNLKAFAAKVGSEGPV